MITNLRTLAFIFLIALATMAPVCVLSGGDTETTSSSIVLDQGALVEVIGENAEIRVSRSNSTALELKVTRHNAEFVDFYTQNLTSSPSSHFVISATTSTGGSTTANSIIELEIPDGTQLAVTTTNRPITIVSAFLTSASLTTSNGKITVTDSAGDYVLTTTNSEVVAQAIDGYVNISTTNAHVWFEGLVDEGSNSISTTNGDVAVRLQSGSDVTVSGNTHNGEVTINGGNEGVRKDGDIASLTHSVANGSASLSVTTGPGAIHINPETIAVFDGDS